MHRFGVPSCARLHAQQCVMLLRLQACICLCKTISEATAEEQVIVCLNMPLPQLGIANIVLSQKELVK